MCCDKRLRSLRGHHDGTHHTGAWAELVSVEVLQHLDAEPRIGKQREVRLIRPARELESRLLLHDHH